MNVLFIGTSSVGPRWIMSALKAKGHRAYGIYSGYEDCKMGEDAVPFFQPVKDGFIKKNKIEIVGITVDSLNVYNAIKISDKIKQNNPGIKIIWGGIHPTIEPGESINYPSVDYICIGEGEYPMIELCESLEDKGNIISKSDTLIKNIWAKKDCNIFKNELRDFIDLDIFDFDREGIIYNGIFTGRGCAGNCAFCASPYIKNKMGIKGRYLRKRKLEAVLSEIEGMIKHNFKLYLKQLITEKTIRGKAVAIVRLLRYITEPIRIKDDSFMIDKKWFFAFIDEFSKRFRRRGFICSARVNEIDVKTVEALKKGNCRTIILGFESGDEAYRNRMLKKQISDAQIREVSKMLKRAGIVILGQWMIGMPGETPDQALKSLKMSLEIGDTPQVHIATPLPKTEMHTIALNAGLLSPGEKLNVSGIYQDFTMVPVDEVNIFRFLYNTFKIINLNASSNTQGVFARFKADIKDRVVGDILFDKAEGRHRHQCV